MTAESAAGATGAPGDARETPVGQGPSRVGPMDFGPLSSTVTHAEARDFRRRTKATRQPWARAVSRFTLRWRRWLRMTRFAEANGFYFVPATDFAGYHGAIFDVGDSRVAYDHLYTASGRFLDIGNYRYSTGSGRERRTHHWGFLALKLDRRLPHTVLDAKGNNRVFGGGLPIAIDKRQVLSLEGNFDRYFSLYCPRGYERDILYLFTPDLLALLIDEGRQFDVELIDDWMFVYSAIPFDMTDPDVLSRLFRIVDTIGAKAVRQTGRYADERVGDRASGTIAPGGRRLRPAAPIAVLAVAAAVIVFLGASAIGLLGSLAR